MRKSYEKPVTTEWYSPYAPRPSDVATVSTVAYAPPPGVPEEGGREKLRNAFWSRLNIFWFFVVSVHLLVNTIIIRISISQVITFRF